MTLNYRPLPSWRQWCWLVVEASKVKWLSPQFTSQLSAGGVSAPSYLIIVTIAKRPFSADSIALPLFTVKNLEFISRTLIATNSDFEVNVATITGNGWGCKVGKVQVTASQSGISNFTILSGISNFTPYFEQGATATHQNNAQKGRQGWYPAKLSFQKHFSYG